MEGRKAGLTVFLGIARVCESVVSCCILRLYIVGLYMAI